MNKSDIIIGIMYGIIIGVLVVPLGIVIWKDTLAYTPASKCTSK